MSKNPIDKDNTEYHETDEPQMKKSKKDRGPTLRYNIEEYFSNNGKKPGGIHLEFNDITRLILLPIIGKKYPCFPTWCKVKGWEKILNTVVIAVVGVSEDNYKENKAQFNRITQLFPEVIPLKLEGSGDFCIRPPLDSFVMYKMPKKLIQEKLEADKGSEEKKTGISKYLLNATQLKKDNFPEWNSSAKEHGVVSTRKTERSLPNEDSQMFCIDCEMCETRSENHALTRVSIVDDQLNVVYDKLVKPNDAITDYMTQYSGITAEMMKGVETKLADVQNDILKIISSDSILVGHSLDFDLRALKLHHDNIIDTSVLFEDHRGPQFKSSLKFLTKKYLRKDIQQSEKGHCSLEDAKSSMELALLKIEKGATFGLKHSGEESVYEALSRNGERGSLIASPDFVSFHSHGNHEAIPCVSDENVVAAARSSIKKSKFTLCELKQYEMLLHRYKNDEQIPIEEKQKAFEEIDKNISLIIESIPPDCLLIVSLCNGFVPKAINNVLKDKEKRRSKEVKQAIRTARLGVCFTKIT